MASLKSIDNLSIKDINEILSGNKFMVQTYKNQLTDRLEYLTKQRNHFPKKYTSVLSKTTAKKKPDESIKTKDFPSLDTESTDVTMTKNKKSFLNFNKIIDKTIINDVNYDQESDPLFVDDKLIIDYNDLKQMYESCAIHRIHMCYLESNRKIQILNGIGLDVKRMFSYDQLFRQSKIMKSCLNLYFQIQDIINCLKLIISIPQESADFKSDMNCSLRDLWPKFKKFKYSIISDYRFDEYIGTLLATLVLSFDNFMSDYDSIDNKTEYLNDTMTDLIDVQNQLCTEFDPKIECNYHISLKRQSGRNLIMNGISRYAYHKFGNISMKPYDYNMTYNNLTVSHIRDLFNQKYKQNSNNLIIINGNEDLGVTKLYIYFTILDEIPFAKGYINFINGGPNMHAFTPFIINPELSDDPVLDKPIVPKFRDPVEKWLRTRIRNELFRPSELEYDQLSDHIKDEYDYENTDKNIFYADYIFDKLQEHDTVRIINSDMLDSFRKLAFKTSIQTKTT